MPTKQPVPPPKTPKIVRLLPGHPHVGRIGELGEPINIITGKLFYLVKFREGDSCYAANYDFEVATPTSPPPPRKK